MDDLLDIFKKTVRQIHGDSLTESEVERLAREWELSSSNYKELTSSVVFSYFNKTISNEKLEKFEADINALGFQLIRKDRSKEVINSIDIVPEVLIVLGSDIVKSILLGAAGSGLWSIVVDWVKYVRTTLKNKKLTKITNSETVKWYNINVYLIFKIEKGGTIGYYIEEGINENELNDILKQLLLEDRPKELSENKEIVFSKKKYRYNHQDKRWSRMN